MPFVVGAVLAYAVLPVANRLDRFMPRWLAALFAELIAVALLVGVALVVVPPLIRGIVLVAGRLPAPGDLQTGMASIQQQVGELPEPVRSIASSLLASVTANLRGTLQGVESQIGAVVTSQILGIFGTLSNVLGLLVIPAWILTMVSDQQTIKQRALRLFPESIRPDTYAIVRIFDRVAGTFLRVRVLLAVTTAFLIWAGLTIANELGVGNYNYAMAAAVLLGVLQLIPELGFFLGFFPILLTLGIGGPETAAVATLVYVLSAKVASRLVETRVSRGVLDVHPGLLIPAIVVLSQFGLVWLFAAAPFVAIVRDLVRYANARLADPPGPAGVIPGERPKGVRTAGLAPRSVPAVYRAPAPAPAAPATTTSGGGLAAPAIVAGAMAAAGAAAIAVTRRPAAQHQSSMKPVRSTGAAAGRARPSAYGNLATKPGARPSAATKRSTNP
jgi:predicted PurR-regulated permease PerM